jgi:uncharacterized surface protein with fasciclin (FAS1) repeats
LATAEGCILFAPTNDAFKDLEAAPPWKLLVLSSLQRLPLTQSSSQLSSHTTFCLTSSSSQPISQERTLADFPFKIGANVADGAVTISSGLLQSSTVTASIEITAGIIHQVDQVLIPPQSISATAGEAELTDLTRALVSQDFLATLEGLEDITVFAPTNEAFDALSEFAAEAGVELTDAVVSAVLALHVVKGVFDSTDIIAAGSAEVITALNGLGAKVSIVNGGVRVTATGNFAAVVVADVLVANGVVHVIDAVLLPNLATLGTGKTIPSFMMKGKPMKHRCPHRSY